MQTIGLQLVEIFEPARPGRLTKSAKERLRAQIKAQVIGQYLGLIQAGGRVPKADPLMDLSDLLRLDETSPLGKQVGEIRVEVTKQLAGDFEFAAKELRNGLT